MKAARPPKAEMLSTSVGPGQYPAAAAYPHSAVAALPGAIMGYSPAAYAQAPQHCVAGLYVPQARQQR